MLKIFRKLGTKTWDANSNLNEAWLNNPYRKGEDDMGRVYGVQGRAWAKPDGGHIDQLKKIVDDLTNGIDDRGEILNFYNPGEFHMGCLRPCMYGHHFSAWWYSVRTDSTPALVTYLWVWISIWSKCMCSSLSWRRSPARKRAWLITSLLTLISESTCTHARCSVEAWASSWPYIPYQSWN